MTKPDAINWGNLNESDTAYFRTSGAPMSTALANNGYAGSDIPDNQDHNTLFRNAYLWEQYLLNRQQANEPTLLYSSGTATWDGSALVLSANLDMSFRIGTGVQINRIAAGTLTFGTDGHVLVLKKDSTTASPITVTSGTYGSLTAGKYAIIAGSSLTATDQENELLIFRRNGTNLEIPAIGLVYPTGSTITFGQAGLSTPPLSIGAYGLGCTLSGGVFTITKDDLTALSSVNSAYVVIPSTTAGKLKLLKISAPISFKDDSNASSDLTGEEYGTTIGRAWNQDRPFYLYAINSDDTDAGLYFAISPTPGFKKIYNNTSFVGYKTVPASTHSDSAITSLTSSSVSSNIVNKPCVCIGSFRMQKSTADDWTVSTLGEQDGIGNFNEGISFYFVAGHYGASAGKFTIGNGPSWATSLGEYQFYRTGILSFVFTFRDTCTNGTDGNQTDFASYISSPLEGLRIEKLIYGGSNRIPQNNFENLGVNYFTAISTISAAINNGWNSATDMITFSGRVQVFIG